MKHKIIREPVKRKCPQCGNDRMWPRRSITGQYAYKCTKCGYKEV